MQKHQPFDPRPKQERVASQCPMDCGTQFGGKESAVLVARPKDGAITTWWSRCQRCLAYWEISPAGEVTALRVITQVDLCPNCHIPLRTTGAEHICEPSA